MKKLLVLTFLCFSSIAIAQTVWIGTGTNTNWNNIDNWSTNLVPTAIDDVVIPNGFTVVLNVDSFVKSIDLQGSSIFNMNRNLTFTDPSNYGINTTVNWSTGSLNGTTSTLNSRGTLNLSGTGTKSLVATTLTNLGTLNFTGIGDLRVNGVDSILNNPIGSVIDFQQNGDIVAFAIPGTLNNAGIIKKTALGGNVFINININNNNGTIQVESGTLNMHNAEKNFTDGNYNIFAGATLDLSGTTNLTGTLQSAIAGTFNWNGIVNFSATLQNTLDGTLNWNANVTVPIGITSAFNFTGNNTINWNGGSLQGGGTLTSNNVMNVSSSAIKFISGDTALTNLGTLNFTGTGSIRVNGANSLINNPIGSIIDLQQTGNITTSSVPGILNNAGIIKRTNSVGAVAISILINNNNGTIQVETGTLNLHNAEKNFTDGNYNIFAGATLDLSGTTALTGTLQSAIAGTFNWNGAINFSGTLQNALDGTLNWNANVTVPVGITSAFNFTGNNVINWNGGTLQGSGTLTSNNVMNIASSAIKFISGDTTLTNLGTLNFTGTGSFRVNGANSLINNPIGSIIDLQQTGSIVTSSVPGTLNNAGIIKRTNSAGVVTISIPINNNNGTIQVETGTLNLNSAAKVFTNGTYNVSLGAILNWNNNVTLLGTLVGTIVGTLNWNQNITIADTTTAIFNFIGIVRWNNGQLLGGGTLNNFSTINLISGLVKLISGNTTLNNSGILNFNGTGDLRVNNANTVLNNLAGGIIDLQSTGDIAFSGIPGTLNNVSLIKKTNSVGTAIISTPFNNNDGTIQVETGTLTITSSNNNFTDGIYNAFVGTTMNWNNNTSLTGTIEADIVGTLNWNGNVNFSGTLQGTLNGTLNWNSNLTILNGNTGTFNLTTANSFNWLSGNLKGGGILNNNNTVNLTSGFLKLISEDTTFNNLATLNLIGNGDLRINGIGSTLNNPLGSIIDIQSASDIISSGVAGTLHNAGTIKKSNFAGLVLINIPLINNNGTIQVETGTLNLNSTEKVFTNGTYNVSNGGILNWNNNMIISGTLIGTIIGDLNWNQTITIADTTTAIFNFTGAINWPNGQLEGGGTLNNLSTININSGFIKLILEDSTLNNSGILNFNGTGDLRINSANSTLNNLTGGIIDLQSTGDISFSGIAGKLNNVSIIKRTNSAGIAIINIPINNNDGTIQVETGTLSITSTNNNFTDGIYNAFVGATMNWNNTTTLTGTIETDINGTLNWNGNVNFSGTVQGNISGTFNWDSNLTILNGNTGTFNLTTANSFNWLSGNLKGGGILNNNNPINLISGFIKLISEDTTLNNLGILNFNGTGDLRINDLNSTLNNQLNGLMDFQINSGNITFLGINSGVLNNLGLIQRTTNLGTVLISVTTNNLGTINIETGELEFTGTRHFTNEVNGIIKGIGTLDLPAISNYTNNGTFAPGSSPGILTVLGDYKSSASSVLDIELNGLLQGTEYDLLAITGNNIVFDGNLNINMGFNGNLGDTFTIATTSGTIATANLPSPIQNVIFNGIEFDFEVTYPDNNKVVLTIIDKLDFENPNVITQDITVQLDATGNVSITPLQIDNGTTDNDTPTNELQFSIDTFDFTCADLGENIVMLTVTDNAGNEVIVPVTVTVEAILSTYNGVWDIIPNAGSKALIKNNYDTNADGNVTACDCEIEIGNTVIINAGGFFNITENILVNGTLTIEPTGSFVQIGNNATVNGAGIFTTKVNTTPLQDTNRFTYFGSPVATTNLNVFSPWAKLGYLWEFDNTIQNWSYIPEANAGTTTMTPGKGFILQAENTQSFPLTATTNFNGKFNNGVFTQTLNFDVYNNVIANFVNPEATGDDDNLLGNPYPSAIDAVALLTLNPNANALYFWTHGSALPTSGNFTTDDYAMRTLAGGTAAPSGATAPTHIATGQGFFVEANASGNFTFNNSVRTVDNNDQFRSSEDDLNNKLWLNLSSQNDDYTNQILIAFLENGTTGFDPQYDAIRLGNNYALSFHSLGLNEEHYAIQTRPLLTNEEIVPIGFYVNEPSITNLTISIDHLELLENANIYLKDHLLNSTHNLKLSDYTFNVASPIELNNRFEILFNRDALNTTDLSTLQSSLIVSNLDENHILIKTNNAAKIATVKIYDLHGKLIVNSTVNNSQTYLTTSVNKGTILLINVTLDNGKLLNKKFIKL